MAKSKSNKRRWVISAVLGILIVGGASTPFILRRREVPTQVQIEKVRRRNLTELVVANGKVQPVTQVKISPEVSGEIIELPVKEGQQVVKGDLLLRIKPDAYVANRRSAEASYQASVSGKDLAEANLRKADAEFKRIAGLFTDRLVSESNYVEARTGLEVAQASFETAKHQVNVAKASLDRAQDELAKTTIYSPLTGTVSKLNSELGERVVGTAMMTGTEVMIVSDLNEMEARVDIGEVDVVLIARGQVARLDVDAFRDRKFTGIVTEIANSSKNLTSGSGGGSQQEATKFEVRIRIAEKEIFRPGMSVTAEIETRYRTNVLSVPIQSVTTRLPAKKKGPENGSKNSTNCPAVADLGAVDLGKSDGRLKEGKKSADSAKPIEVVFGVRGERVVVLPVKRGISDDAYMEITEGVEEGQEVVSGSYKAISRDLDDGKKVKQGQPKANSSEEKNRS